MGMLENRFQDNVVVAKLDKLIGWARSTSPWYFQFGLACCAIEMMAAAASRHDLERLGMMPRSSPRQADVMIVAGTVTMKMALRVKKLYEQMADPKYVIAMSACIQTPACPTNWAAMIRDLPRWQNTFVTSQNVRLRRLFI